MKMEVKENCREENLKEIAWKSSRLLQRLIFFQENCKFPAFNYIIIGLKNIVN
jgi:hypothetical protein